MTVNDLLEIKEAHNKGLGLFALRNISKDEFIFEFIGDVIKEDIFLSEKNIKEHAVQVSEHEWVYKNNYYTYLINHSCSSNCGIDGLTKVVAMKDIKIGEELTIDYELFENNKYFNLNCICGENDCRKSVGGAKKPSDDFIKKYNKYISKWIREKFSIILK